MTLTSKDVAEITRLLEQSAFTELHLELEGLKFSLKRGAERLCAAPPEPPGEHRRRRSRSPTACNDTIIAVRADIRRTFAPATAVMSWSRRSWGRSIAHRNLGRRRSWKSAQP